MERSGFLATTTFAVLVGSAGFVHAAQPVAGEAEPSNKAARLVLQRIPPDRSEAAPLLKRRILQLQQLRDMIVRAVKPDEEQTAAIHALFEEEIAGLPVVVPAPPRVLMAGEKPTEKWLADQAVWHSITETPLSLLAEVKDLLNAEQRETVEAVVQRWAVIYVRNAGEGPMRLLFRAVRDPGLEVSDSMREVLTEIIRHAVEPFRGKGPIPYEELERAASETEAKIRARLSDSSQAHFAATLRRLREDRAKEGTFDESLRVDRGQSGASRN